MRKFLKKVWFFICTWVTSSAVFYFGIKGLIDIENIPEQYNFLSSIVVMLAAIVMALVINYINFSLATRQKLKETQTKIDELKQITHSKMNELKESVRYKPQGNSDVTADDFFITRNDIESITTVIDSNPKSIKYSGGNVSIISAIKESSRFINYITVNDVKIQFLFPDTNNNAVIENLANNITTHKKNTYKGRVNNAVKMLDDLITEHNLKDKVEYRFYKFVPSFGLQIIEDGNNDRLYVDLFTIGIPKDERLHFKIEKKHSLNKYLVFKNQFEELWNKSQEKKPKLFSSEWFRKIFNESTIRD